MSRIPLPRLRIPLPRLRMPRPPLPLTAATILLFLGLPLVGLLRLPRPQAQGLEKLLSAASLVQSFPPSPDRPVPALWQERLGAGLANSLWRAQNRTWWQFWGVHSDVPPYLALPATGVLSGPPASLPLNALRLDDVVVLAPDALSLRLLQDRLLPQQRRSRGLQGRCAELLRRDQAVFWDPGALAVMVGPLAPLLQEFQEGCLRLELDPLGLRWQGEAASVDGVLLPLPTRAPLADVPLQPPLPADRLLELEGDSLAPLLRGLLSRQLIREPLSRTYGLDERRQARGDVVAAGAVLGTPVVAEVGDPQALQGGGAGDAGGLRRHRSTNPPARRFRRGRSSPCAGPVRPPGAAPRARRPARRS